MVTVVLTCYDHERFVEQALDAVRAQTYRPIQLIVTDDASSDDSAARIRHWVTRNWPDAQLILHTVNVGLCRTLNEALALATGDYVTISSADDWMEPERIETLVAAFESAPPEVGLVYSGVRLVDSKGNELSRVRTEPGSGASGWIFHQELTMPTVLTPGVMVRRSVFDVVGGFNEADIVEDYDMWLRICRSFQVLHVPGALVNFRWHEGNTTTRIHGEPYDRYVATCLRRQLGFSRDADRIIRNRLRALERGDGFGGRKAIAPDD